MHNWIKANPDIETETGLTLSAKEDGDDIKVSCRMNKFAAKVMTIFAFAVVLGFVAVRFTSTKAADFESSVDMLGAGDPCSSNSACAADEHCCHHPWGRGMFCYTFDSRYGICPYHD